MAFSLGYETTPTPWATTGGTNTQFNSQWWQNYKSNVEKLNETRKTNGVVPEYSYSPFPTQEVQPAVQEIAQTQAYIPTISQNMLEPTIPQIDYSALAKAIKAEGIGGFTDTSGAEKLSLAEKTQKISAASKIGSSVLGMLDARQNYVNVKKMKTQYENQKKIIDANVANQEALMMDNYNERMASADALYAAKNIDISSGALTGVKQQGAMEMGKDFQALESQANINKLALDLDYAIRKRQAKNAEWDAYISGAFNIGTSVATLFAGGI